MGKKVMKTLENVTVPLAGLGALTWGTQAWLNFNLVEMLLGGFPLVLKVTYGLVGVGGIFLLGMWIKKLMK